MKLKLIGKSLLYLSLIINCSCSNKQKIRKGDILQYDLTRPNQHYYLPYELQEVSGLTYVNDSIVAMVQDENGILYFFNLNQKKVTRKLEFAKDGDFEGIEFANDTAYAMKSNGDIIRFGLNSRERPQIIETPLSSKNDVEGLGYDRDINSLIIACKESPNIKNTDFKGKAIYLFDLDESQFIYRPICIEKSHIIEYLKLNSMDIHFNEFRPSAIASHPNLKDYYILSHGGKLLISVNKEEKITGIEKLNESLFFQPEGICFAPNGDMFIANEGGKVRSTLLKFSLK